MFDWLPAQEYSEWLLLQHGYIIYVILTALLLSGAVGLPIPEDVPLIIAGVLVQRGNADLTLAFLVCYGAILLGDVLIFALGYKIGPKLFQTRFFKAKFTPELVGKITSGLERHALVMIFLARHLFYLRSATFLTCGAFRMNFLRFLAADAVAALISAPLMMGLGFLASEHLPALFEIMGRAKTASLIIGITGFGLFVAIYLQQRRRQRRHQTVD